MANDWITDRRPTEADGDGDGDVRVRYSPGSDDSCYLHWSYVGEGAPWKHCDAWQPLAPEPAKPALAVGQRWRRRDGVVVTIEIHDTRETSYPFHAAGHWYRANGTSCIDRAGKDLIELISEPESQPQPATTTPRKFVAISSYYAEGVYHTDAIADDGTAWRAQSNDHAWTQYTPLPAREVPADA